MYGSRMTRDLEVVWVMTVVYGSTRYAYPAARSRPQQIPQGPFWHRCWAVPAFHPPCVSDPMVASPGGLLSVPSLLVGEALGPTGLSRDLRSLSCVAIDPSEHATIYCHQCCALSNGAHLAHHDPTFPHDRR